MPRRLRLDVCPGTQAHTIAQAGAHAGTQAQARAGMMMMTRTGYSHAFHSPHPVSDRGVKCVANDLDDDVGVMRPIVVITSVLPLAAQADPHDAHRRPGTHPRAVPL
jgi:hypothetical protein